MQGPNSGKLRNSLYDLPLMSRGMGLPLGTYQNQDGSESAGFAWPGFLTDAYDASQIPGR